MNPSAIPAVRLEGLRLDAVDEGQCVDHVMSSVTSGRGGWIVTPNLDHLRRMAADPALQRSYECADLAVADGMPLVWACRLQRTPIPGRVAGSDLIWSLSCAASRHGASVFLLGGASGIAEGAAEHLCARAPGLRIVGTACPPFGFEHEPHELARLEEQLAAARPDIVFVALGSPKQERAIERLRHVLPGAWWIGVGISFSFVAGEVKRAPHWLGSIGGEWIHRLWQEPRRLARRYLLDGLPFAFALMTRAALRGLHVRAAPRNR